jgi:ADP-heptose:LPS heptosyltransferase
MDLDRARSILVCLRWGIGDLVMELPLLEALRRRVPDARLTALGAAPAVELLEGAGVLDAVRTAQDFGLRHWGDSGSDAGRAAIADWCRQAAFDCVLDARHAARGVQMALWDLNLPHADTGTFDDVERLRGLDGAARLAVAATAAWRVDVPEADVPVLRLHERERRAAAELRRRLAPDAPLIGVAPIASSALKRGAASEFARAADLLAEDAAARVAVFAGDQPGVAGSMLEVMAQRHRARVVPAMHLRSTAALLAECRALICNDTGLMHLAAAVGTPVIAVFACTSARLYLPRGGTPVPRWREPCSHPVDDFGVAPCVAAGRCLDPAHRPRAENWAGAAVAAARGHLGAG